jgi:predicted RecA/RadA family phage recombinase
MKKNILFLTIVVVIFNLSNAYSSALSQFQIQANYLVSNKLNVANSNNTTPFKVDIGITRMLYMSGYENVDWTVTVMYSPSGNTGSTDNIALSTALHITETNYTTNNPGVFSTAIDATLPANKTTGAIFLKYVYYLYDGNGYKNPQPLTQYSATYGISATTPVTIFYSAARSVPFTKVCTPGSIGSVVNYVLSYGKYTSKVNQGAADALATADINANGQNYANSTGICRIPLANYNITLEGTPGYLDTKTMIGSTVTGGNGTVTYAWEISFDAPISPGVWSPNSWGILTPGRFSDHFPTDPLQITENLLVIPKTALKFPSTVYIRRKITSGDETVTSNVITFLRPVSTNPTVVINSSGTKDSSGKFKVNTSATFTIQNPAPGVTYDFHYLTFAGSNVPIKVIYVASGTSCQTIIGPAANARPDFLYVYGSDGSETDLAIYKTN